MSYNNDHPRVNLRPIFISNMGTWNPENRLYMRADPAEQYYSCINTCAAVFPIPKSCNLKDMSSSCQLIQDAQRECKSNCNGLSKQYIQDSDVLYAINHFCIDSLDPTINADLRGDSKNKSDRKKTRRPDVQVDPENILAATGQMTNLDFRRDCFNKNLREIIAEYQYYCKNDEVCNYMNDGVLKLIKNKDAFNDIVNDNKDAVPTVKAYYTPDKKQKALDHTIFIVIGIGSVIVFIIFCKIYK